MCRECSCFSRSCRSVSPMRPRPCWSKCDANRVEGISHANSDTCKKIDVEKSVRGQFADTADSQPEEGGGQERSPRRSAHAFDALALAILTPHPSSRRRGAQPSATLSRSGASLCRGRAFQLPTARRDGHHCSPEAWRFVRLR